VSVLLEYLSKAELTFAEHNNNYRCVASTVSLPMLQGSR